MKRRRSQRGGIRVPVDVTPPAPKIEPDEWTQAILDGEPAPTLEATMVPGEYPVFSGWVGTKPAEDADPLDLDPPLLDAALADDEPAPD